MIPDQDSANSFYYDALSDYVDSCWATCELYVEGQDPAPELLIAEGMRFTSVFKRLKFITSVANRKFGKQFIMPQFLFDTKGWEKTQ